MMATSPHILYDYAAIERAMEEYYSSSASGGGGNYVHGTIFSRGKGLGSALRSVMRIATPIVKKAVRVLKPMAKKAGKYVLKKGAEAATDIAIDVLEGVPIEDAARHRAAIAAENVKYDAVEKLKSHKRKKCPST